MLLEKTSPTIRSDFDRTDLRIGVLQKKQCVKHTAIISQEPVLLQELENNILLEGIAEGIPASTPVVEGVYLPKEKEKPRAKGNRCGHDPKNMRFFQQLPNQGRRFYVLEEGQRRVKEAYAKPFDYPMFHALLFHRNKEGEIIRRIRSEKRESALFLLIPAIFNSVNLVTMELGHFNGTEFINYDCGYFVKVTKQNYSRIQEAVAFLKKEGLIEVKTVIKMLADGFIRTERVVITVTEKMFHVFGLGEALLIDRERALCAHAKKEKQADERKKYLALFQPKPSKREQEKQSSAIASVKALTTHFKIVKNTSTTMPSSPLSDRAVKELTHTLFLSGDHSTLMSAATEACRRLNKPPPLNSS